MRINWLFHALHPMSYVRRTQQKYVFYLPRYACESPFGAIGPCFLESWPGILNVSGLMTPFWDPLPTEALQPANLFFQGCFHSCFGSLSCFSKPVFFSKPCLFKLARLKPRLLPKHGFKHIVFKPVLQNLSFAKADFHALLDQTCCSNLFCGVLFATLFWQNSCFSSLL